MDEPAKNWFAAPRPRGTPAFSDDFPTIAAEVVRHASADIDDDQWQAPDLDFWTFDRSLDEREGERFRIAVKTASPERTLAQILTRCQRLIRRRNRDSSGALFDRVIEAHAALYDLTLPLVRADFDHALDVWQWVLRLDPGAGLAVQIAALYHDVERLESEPVRRTEHTASDYVSFKAAHARAGAGIAETSLTAAGVPATVAQAAAVLVAGHESTGTDPERGLLNEADALSFFSLNSPGFFDYFDPEHCWRKVRYTLGRMSARSRALIPTLRLRGDVARMLREAGGLTT